MMLTEADFLSALHGYISEITGMDGARIFRGNQSRMVLPKTGGFCIYTPIFRRRRGTNTYGFDATGKADNENGVDTMTALVLVDVQADFYGANAMLDAQAVEMASRSYIGTDYFKGQGIDVRVCTAENPRNLTGIDTANQYEKRWSVVITAEVNAIYAIDLPWFEDVHFRHRLPGTDPAQYTNGFINVDAEFPPTA